MGCCFDKEESPVTLVVFGLDGAGKTTLLTRLTKKDRPVRPTRGFEVEKVKLSYHPQLKSKPIPHIKSSSKVHPRGIETSIKNNPSRRVSVKQSATLYDLGGAAGLRGIWRNYLADVHGCIYVIDWSDPSRLGESVQAFKQLYTDPKMMGKPVLLLVNKIPPSPSPPHVSSDIFVPPYSAKITALPLLNWDEEMPRRRPSQLPPLIQEGGVSLNPTLSHFQPTQFLNSTGLIDAFSTIPADQARKTYFIYGIEQYHTLPDADERYSASHLSLKPRRKSSITSTSSSHEDPLCQGISALMNAIMVRKRELDGRIEVDLIAQKQAWEREKWRTLTRKSHTLHEEDNTGAFDREDGMDSAERRRRSSICMIETMTLANMKSRKSFAGQGEALVDPEQAFMVDMRRGSKVLSTAPTSRRGSKSLVPPPPLNTYSAAQSRRGSKALETVVTSSWRGSRSVVPMSNTSTDLDKNKDSRHSVSDSFEFKTDLSLPE